MASETPNAQTETADALDLAATVNDGYSRLKRRLRAEGGAAEVTPSQGSALRQLHLLGPTTVTELAAAEGVRPQSMGATVASLQALGYVTGAPDPADGRRTILTLTPTVLEQFSANQSAGVGWLYSAIQNTLSADERRDLARGFAVLAKLVESTNQKEPLG